MTSSTQGNSGEIKCGQNPFESAESLDKEEDDDVKTTDGITEAERRSKCSPGNRARIAPTVALYMAFFACGLGSSILGPTIVSMEIVLNTTTNVIALAFTSSAVGCLIGTVICGIVYDGMNKELFFLTSGFILTVTLATAPFLPHVYAFIAVMALKDVGSGLMQTGGTSYILQIWQSSPFQESAMQAVTSFWSFGATVGPFLVSLFLVPLPDTNETETEVWNSTQNEANGSFPSMTVFGLVTTIASDPEFQSNASSSLTPSLETIPDYRENSDVSGLGRVRFAYLATAGLVVFAPIAFTMLFVRNGASCKLVPHKNGATNATSDTSSENAREECRRTTRNEASRCFTITLTALLLCLCLLLMFMDVTTGQVIASYVIKVLGWSNKRGALLTSVFFGAHTTSRALAIVSSALVPAKYLIIVDSLLILAGFIMMAFAHFHDIVTWIAACLMGFGMGTCYPCVILMGSRYMFISGRIGALFYVCIGLASLSGPWCITFLMEEIHPNSFVYAGLTCSLLACVVLVGTRLFIRKCAGKTPCTASEQGEKIWGNKDATPEVTRLKEVNSSF